MMVAGAVALTAMMGYAFLSGLIEIEVIDERKAGNEMNQSRSYEKFHDVLDDGDGKGASSEQGGQEGDK